MRLPICQSEYQLTRHVTFSILYMHRKQFLCIQQPGRAAEIYHETEIYAAAHDVDARRPSCCCAPRGHRQL